MSARTEKQKRIQNGERPYLMNGQLVFRKEEPEFGCDEETGAMVSPLPTEDSLMIGLHGRCCVLHWNSISEEEFLHLTSGIVTLDELRDLIDQPSYHQGTSGYVSGGITGQVHGYKETYEAYVDPEAKVEHFPLELDSLPIQENNQNITGQYILFCIDEDTCYAGGVDIPNCQFDQSRLEPYVERFRFGEIYFDMTRLRYEDQIGNSGFQPPLTEGLKVFALDPKGMLHGVVVDLEIIGYEVSE